MRPRRKLAGARYVRRASRTQLRFPGKPAVSNRQSATGGKPCSGFTPLSKSAAGENSARSGVTAADTPDRALFSPAADFESGVKPEQGLPPVADWRFDTAGFPGNRSCVLLARLTYLAPASFRRGRIDCFAVLGENHAVNALCDITA